MHFDTVVTVIAVLIAWESCKVIWAELKQPLVYWLRRKGLMAKRTLTKPTLWYDAGDEWRGTP